MDAPVETAGRRLRAVYLWGALFVLAWAAVTALLGGGDARADDQDAPALDDATSLVSDATDDSVGPVISGTAATVVDSARPATEAALVVESTKDAVAQTPVVGEPAAETVAPVSQAASTGTAVVADAVAEAPVAPAVAPVTDALRDVPLVGGALEELATTGLVDEVVSTVDTAIDEVAPVVDAGPVVEALQPTIPELFTAPARVATTSSAADAVAPLVVRSDLLPRAVMLSIRGSSTPPAGADPAGLPPGVAASSTAASAGGGGPGQSSDSPPGSHPFAGMSTLSGIPADSALPPSPAGSTDVSPD